MEAIRCDGVGAKVGTGNVKLSGLFEQKPVPRELPSTLTAGRTLLSSEWLGKC
jgi:hypothetical protein